MDFYDGATNSKIYLEPNCSAHNSTTFAELDSKFSTLFDAFTAAKTPVLLAAADYNKTTYPVLDIKALEKTMTPLTKLLEGYKHKLFCEKLIKDYSRDLEELAKSNKTIVQSYINMVEKVILEIPALRKISSNDTDSKVRGNCTYLLPATNATTDSTSNDTSSANITGSALPNVTANSSAPANGSNASSTTDATTIAQIIAKAINHNGGHV